jgi:hypothetical protein
MAWLLRKMAWFNLHLVQLHNFWTSNALIFAKWQHIKQGFFRHFQGQQLSYIVYDIMKVMYNFNNKFFFRFKSKSIYERCNFLCELQFMLNTLFNLIIAFTHNINWPWALP